MDILLWPCSDLHKFVIQDGLCGKYRALNIKVATTFFFFFFFSSLERQESVATTEARLRMEGVELKEEWQDEDFPRYCHLIMFQIDGSPLCNICTVCVESHKQYLLIPVGLLDPFRRKRSLRTSFLQERLKREPPVMKLIIIGCMTAVTQENIKGPIHIFHVCPKIHMPTSRLRVIGCCTLLLQEPLKHAFQFFPQSV